MNKKDIELVRINSSNAGLLREVAIVSYSQHYLHLWYDDGKWYIDKSFSMQSLEQELNDPNAWFYVIYYEEKAIGFFKLNIDAPLANHDTNALELERIYLTREAGRKGIGAYVLSETIEIARSRNKKLVWLKVMDSSENAIRFYEKNGFQICGTARLGFETMKPEYRGMYIMKKKL